MSEWNWKLRLFLSADLVGSTAFKSSKVDRYAPEWAPTFKDFFRDFPPAVNAAYQRVPQGCQACEERLTPWKFSGDEILFWVQLNNHCEVATHLWAFKQAVSTFPEQWARKKVPLRLKATAWLAGFPVTNSEIKIGNALDFIGPAIDLGFRISKFSSVRRFTLSADLALMLLDAVDKCEIDRKHFHVYLHGREFLKGVIGNEPYPITWLDMNDGDLDLEEQLLGVHRDFRPDHLKDFLRSFIDATPLLRRPFINGDNDTRYGMIPPELEELRMEMQAEDSDRTYLTSQGNDDADAEGEPREIKGLPDELPPGPLTLSDF